MQYEEEKESHFRILYKEAIKPLPGLKVFLDKLDQYKIRRAIGTSAPRTNVDFVLSETKLGQYFTTILDESDVDHGKPHPEIYLKVAAAVGLPPARCIVFEDSLSGVTAAQTAGSKVVGVATTHTAQELAHTDLVITDFLDIDPLQLITRLFKP
jgi:HAD superfamily hydrolase (TIGR01509 family)